MLVLGHVTLCEDTESNPLLYWKPVKFLSCSTNVVVLSHFEDGLLNFVQFVVCAKRLYLLHKAGSWHSLVLMLPGLEVCRNIYH